MPGRIGEFNGSVIRHDLSFVYVYVGFSSCLKVIGALLWAYDTPC